MPFLSILSSPQSFRPSSTWTHWGQWLALITMTADHLSRYLATEWGVAWVSSSVGRIAFPLFAGMVAWHGLFNTRDPLRYARRILTIGIVAQLPYGLMPRDGFQLNICFTLALGLCWGTLLRELVRGFLQPSSNLWWLVFGATGSFLAWFLVGRWVEYGHLGLLVIPSFMLALHALNQPLQTLTERFFATTAALPILAIAGLMNSSEVAKFVTLTTCLTILLLAAGAASRISAPRLKMPRRIWLSWYPAHFAAIALLLYWPT